MKRVSAGILLLALLAGCGGGSGTKTTTSGIKNRAFVSNAQTGVVQLVDATADALSATTIGTAIGAGPMALSPGRELTLVVNTPVAGVSTVSVINNSTEQVSGTISGFSDFIESIVVKDTTTAFAAVPNAGAVGVLDLQNFNIKSAVGVADASRLAMNNAGTRLLVFSRNSDTVNVIDLTATTLAATQVTGFNRPVVAVFSSDDSTAFVLNCGPECGGTTASVQPLMMASSTAGTAVPVSAATAGLLSGSTLFVAGTPNAVPGLLAGRLNSFDISSGAPVSGSVKDVPIGDGTHGPMALGSNNKLFIGATNCTNDPNSKTGCLTIFDTGANTAVVDVGKGPVTGMAPISSRNIVYVCEGGELRIYDTTTSAESTQHSIDIIGRAVDVKAIDQTQ